MAKRKFDPVHPGVVLAEDFLKGLEISQYRLAKGISVSARRINEIVQGKRSITADTARLPIDAWVMINWPLRRRAVTTISWPLAAKGVRESCTVIVRLSKSSNSR